MKENSALVTLFSIVLLTYQFACTGHELIQKIDRSKHAVTYYFNPLLMDTGYALKNSLSISFDDSIDLTQLDETIITAPLILSIAPIIWLTNKKFSIKKMDEDLYYSLKKINKVFKFFWPEKSWSGKIVPGTLVKNNPKSTKTSSSTQSALCFSHGLDAITSAIIHKNEHPFLLCLIKEKKKDAKIFRHLVSDFAKMYHDDAAFFKSNFQSVINARRVKDEFGDTINWSLALAGAVVPILVKTGISTLFIASTYTRDYPFPWGSHPLIDNAIQVAGIRVIHDDPDHNRIEKVETIVNHYKKNNVPLPFISVCHQTANEQNCSWCDKCLRTMNDIVAVGQDPRSFGFSLSPKEVTKKTRTHLENRLKKKTQRVVVNTFWIDIQDFIKKGTYQSFYNTLDKEFFSWIKDVHLESKNTFLLHKRDIYPKFKNLLTLLWDQSVNGTLDYDSLHHMKLKL